MIVRAMSCLACAAAGVCMPIVARGESQADARAFAAALEYFAAPGCPDVNEFKAIVVGRLGYDVFRSDARDRVLVDIAPRGSAFEGHIERRNAEGRWAGDRTFPSRSEDCGELGRAMAFALALQIQLSATASASPGAAKMAVANETGNPSETLASSIPVPLAAAPPSNVQEKTPAPTKETSSPTSSPYLAPRPTLAIGAGGLLGFGLSSSAVPIGRAFGSAAWQQSSLELAAEVAWPTTTRREDGAGFSQQLLLVGVAGCGALQRWSACLLAKAGEIRIVGKDVDSPRSLSGPILETGLRLAVLQHLGRHIYVAARVEGLVNVTRWSITLDQNLVWSAPRFAAAVGLDIGVRLLHANPSEDAIAQAAGGRDE